MLLDAIRERRSIRKYTGEPVSEEQIREILEAAFLAPTASNRQEWRFAVVQDREKLAKMAEIHPYGKMIRDCAFSVIVGTKKASTTVSANATAAPPSRTCCCRRRAWASARCGARSWRAANIRADSSRCLACPTVSRRSRLSSSACRRNPRRRRTAGPTARSSISGNGSIHVNELQGTFSAVSALKVPCIELKPKRTAAAEDPRRLFFSFQ